MVSPRQFSRLLLLVPVHSKARKPLASWLARQTSIVPGFEMSNRKRYGFLAAMPNILNKEDALAEVAYALDILKQMV